MKIELTRICRYHQAIDGELKIHGVKICDTVENANSLLPAGEYPILRCMCHQYERKMPLIQFTKGKKRQPSTVNSLCKHCDKLDEPNLNARMPCYCPMLKPGNGVLNRTDGSIILGQRIAAAALKHPNDTFTIVSERIRKAIARGIQVTLVIK